MPLPARPLDQLTEGDLVALIQNAVSESKFIDYKERLPGNTDGEKKEFLYDISSLANTSGGQLLFGVRAKDGIPTELVGIENLNGDAEKLRFHNMIQSGVQPRIPGVEMQPIALQSGKSVLVVQVPKSWASPHMVTFQGASRFYSRNSAGKYPLDVSEIRAAFLLSETVGNRIRSFRAERIAAVIADQTPVTLHGTRRLLLHLLSLQSFSPGFSVDLKRIHTLSPDVARPMQVDSGFGSHYTFDGVAFFELIREQICITYTHVFRNGCIEVVNSHSLHEAGEGKFFFAEHYERVLAEYLTILLRVLSQLAVPPPFFLGLSLLGVRGFSVYVPPGSSMFGRRSIDRDNLVIPEVVIDSYTPEIPSILRPSFDSVWNACGYAGSRNYDAAGNWRGTFHQVR